MKPIFPFLAVTLTAVAAEAADAYINTIRQVDLANPGLELDAGSATVADSGSQASEDPVGDQGATFELRTMLATAPYTEYLLDSRTVGSYFPLAEIQIITKDPYTVIPRTRVDQSFEVIVTISELLSGESDPLASKSVNFLHHTQWYGDGGTGVGINRDDADLLTTESISTNGASTHLYTSMIEDPALTDFTKVRGEERFSVYSLEDKATPGYSVEAEQLASKYVQIWPMASGSIEGINEGDRIMYAVPQLTLTYLDLYPSSTTYAQVYKGPPQDNMIGVVIPGSAKTYAEPVPQNAVLTLTNWDNVLTEDGVWTIELVTVTPFGTERIAPPKSITRDRTIEVNSNITTSD